MMRLTLTLLLLSITITVNNAIAQTTPTRLHFHSSPVIPPPREHALTVTFEDGRIFYGGGTIYRPINESTSEMATVYQHDTWLYSPTTLQWSRISDLPYNTDNSNSAHRINDTIYILDWTDSYVIMGKSVGGVGNLTWSSHRFFNAPSRDGSTSTLFPTNPNLILAAGGYFDKNIHTFDTVSLTWTTITPVTTFTTRSSHSMCTYQNQIFLAGGVYTESGTTKTTVYGDVWGTNDAVNWNRLTASAFPPRWGHTLSVFSSQLFVTGGSANGVPLDDVWSSIDGITWFQLATLRQPRYYHKAIDNGAGFLYILGGTYDPTNHNRPAIHNEYYQGYRSIVKDVQIINQNNGLSLTWDVPFGMNPPITNFTITIRNNNNTAEMYTLPFSSTTRQLLFSTNNIYINDITQPHIWLVKGNSYDINITMSTDMYVGETYTAKDVKGIQSSPQIDTPIVTVDGAHDGVLSLTWSLGTHDIDSVTFPISYTLYDSQRNIINIVNITQSDIKINQNIRYVSRDIKVMNTSTPTVYTLCVSTLFQPTERCSAPTDAVTTPPTPILVWEVSSPSIDGINVISTKNTFPAIAWGCMITYNNTYYLMGGERVNMYGEGWLVNEIWSSQDGLIWMYQGNATWSPRAHHSCVVVNDTIVVLGGLVSYGYPEHPLGGSISSLYLNATGINMTSTEVWTYNNNIWTQAENTPHLQTMDTFAIVASNQSLYVLGGYDGVNNITNAMWERFMNGTWLLHPTPTFSPRYGHNGIWYHNQLYIMGGFGDVGAVQFRGARTYSDVHRYDPNTGVWTALTTRRLPNPSTRGWFGITVIRDQMTIIQGFADGTSSSCNDCIRDEQWLTTDGEQWIRALPYPSKLGSIYNYPNAINIRFGFYMLTYGDEIRILGGVIPIQDSLQVNKYLTDIYTTRGGVVAPNGAPYLEQQPPIHPSRQFRLIVNPPVFPDYFYDKAKLSAYIPSSIEVTNITMWLYRVPDTSVVFGSTHVVGEQGTDGRSALALNATLIATNTSYNTPSHKITLSMNDNSTIAWGHAYQVILIAYNSLGASHPLIMKPQYAYCRPDPIPEISVINDHHGIALIQFDSHFYGGMDIQLSETLLEYHIFAVVGNEEMEMATLNVDRNITRYYTYIPFNINSTEDSMYLDTPIRFRIELRDINNYLKTIGYSTRLSSFVTITSDRPTLPPTTATPTTPTPTIEPSSSSSSTGGSSSNGTSSPTSSTSGITTASPSTTSPPSTTSKPTTNSSSPSSTGPVTSIDSSSSSTAPQPNLPNTGLQHETHFLLSCVILLFTYIFAH